VKQIANSCSTQRLSSC